MWERESYIFSCAVGGGDNFWTLENVATMPAYRRQGLTLALINSAIQEGRQEGYEHMQVATFIGNEPAIRAYESMGFEVVEENTDKEFEKVTGTPGMCRLERRL